MTAAATQFDRREPKAHPAAELFPMLSDEALEPIVDSMRIIGFDTDTPILRYRGAILDGRNRLRAAAIAGVEPIFRDVPDSIDPYEESWRLNGMRRDLTPGLRAAITAKITIGSVRWQMERDVRQNAANAARAEKARGNQHASKTRPENSPPSFDGAPKDETRSATAATLAAKAGVSRPTMERALKLARTDPEKLDATIRGEKPARKKPNPRVDHDARNADVLRLMGEGLTNVEIGSKLKIHSHSVSKSRNMMGVTENAPTIKLWSDVDHAATTLEGAALQLEQLALRVDDGELNANEQEIRRCIKSLSRSLVTVKALRSALQRKLPR